MDFSPWHPLPKNETKSIWGPLKGGEGERRRNEGENLSHPKARVVAVPEYYKTRCTATNRAGERCGRPPVKGSTVCRFHGGLSPKGPASANWKHGRSSRYVPARMREAVEAIKSDKSYLNLSHETATAKVLYDETLRKIEEGGTADAWKRLRSLRAEVLDLQEQAEEAQTEARRLELQAAQSEALGRMLSEVERSEDALQALDEYHRHVNTLVKLVDTERKRLESAQAYARQEEVEGVVARLAALVLDEIPKHVEDVKERRMLMSGIAIRAKILFDEMFGPGPTARKLPALPAGDDGSSD